MTDTATKPRKKYNVRPTKFQRAVAANVVEKGLSPHKAILEAGGAEATAHNSHKITAQSGFKLALAEYGLTEELVTTALVSDIKDKPKNRVQELSLASKILGMVKTEAPQAPITNTYNLFYQPQFQERVKAFETDVKDLIAYGNTQASETPVAVEPATAGDQ